MYSRRKFIATSGVAVAALASCDPGKDTPSPASTPEGPAPAKPSTSGTSAALFLPQDDLAPATARTAHGSHEKSLDGYA
jgi:hypothetical protein